VRLEGALRTLLPAGARVIDLQSKGMMRSVPRLLSYLQREDPCALFSTMTHANVIAGICGRFGRSSRAVILRQSNGPLTDPKLSVKARITHALIPRSYRRARAVIAVSEGVANELSTMDEELRSKISVEPTPVIASDFFEKADEPVDHEWFNDDGPPIVLGVGRLEECKGFHGLIRAFADVNRTMPARLLILGEGRQRSVLEAYSKELGLEGAVSLPGFRRNPFSYMKRARVFVLSSHNEGLPNVLIQAIALGTRVVATDCPHGPREILSIAQTGELVSPGDCSRMAAAIRHSLSVDDATHTEQSIGAQERICRRFGAHHATLRYLAAAGLQ
jgi:glycosyltransferase involved in cell wall biosynthesis